MARMARSICDPSLCRSALVLILAGGAILQAQRPGVELRNGAFVLAPWTGGAAEPARGWPSALAIYAGSADTPMLGTYAVEGDALIFHPRFPLAAGMGYHGTWQGGRFMIEPPNVAIHPAAR